MDQATPYANLSPDLLLDATDAAGYPVSGTLLALNSYENRVYQIGLEDGRFIIAKFYRPGRWDRNTILEEHNFSAALAAAEIPVVAPLADDKHRTLFEYAGYLYALFPRQGGRPPELDDPHQLRHLGRMLGRVHALGAAHKFQYRPGFSVQRFGHDAVAFLFAQNFVPKELAHNYRLVTEKLLSQVESIFMVTGSVRQFRLHGDCHPGNILWTDQGPHFVDLDDCMTGPAIQDLWMLLAGSREDMQRQLDLLLEGYTVFSDFDPIELNLIEALRALRMLHYSAWLAKRWHDPAFPLAFPWFNSPRYWEDQLNTLRDQVERLNEPPLEIN